MPVQYCTYYCTSNLIEFIQKAIFFRVKKYSLENVHLRFQ